MLPRQILPALSRRAAVFCSLLSAACLSACADHPTVVAASPPPVIRPCELPYLEKAGPLPPQQNLDQPLDGAGFSTLEAQDAGAYNALYPRYNANQDWAGLHCQAKADAPPAGK